MGGTHPRLGAVDMVFLDRAVLVLGADVATALGHVQLESHLIECEIDTDSHQVAGDQSHQDEHSQHITLWETRAT